MLHGEEVEKENLAEELKTTSGQKNPHEDNNVVSPALNKDVIPIDDEKEAVGKPERALTLSLPILISGSTQASASPPQPVQILPPPADDDDNEVNFGNPNAFDDILSASFVVPEKEITIVSGLEMQKSFGKPSSLTPTQIPPPTQFLMSRSLPISSVRSRPS